MEHKIAEFRGYGDIRLEADVWGAEMDSPVLLLHGGGQTRRAWEKTGKALAEAGWQAIAVDLRGHGESDWSSTGAYSVDDFARDLISISEQIGKSMSVVGASLGGLAALLAEGELARGSFNSLTLVDIAPRMENIGVDKVVGFMGAHVDEGFTSEEEAAEIISAYMPHRPKPKNVSGLKKYLKKGDDGRYRWHWDPKFISNIVSSSGVRRYERFEEASRKLTIPVQLIRGRMSELVSEESVRAFLDCAPHVVYDDITGAGHMVVGDQNDAFMDAILAFLCTVKNGESMCRSI